MIELQNLESISVFIEEHFMTKNFTLCFSTLVFLFEFWLQLRQHKKFFCKKIPQELEKAITEEEFSKSQRYNYDKSKFTLFEMVFDYLQLLLIYIYSILPFIWKQSSKNLFFRKFLPANISSFIFSRQMDQALTFLIVLSVLSDLISLPFSLYSTFVVEEKHGFNKQTLRLFFVDFVKVQCLKFVFGIPVIWIILSIIEKFTNFALYVQLFLFAFKIIMMSIYPTLIQPCFNKVIPLETGELRQKIEALAMRVKFPLKKLYKIDGSKRSSHSNAYMYGFCNNKRIVLFDTLIDQCNHEEIVAVLAHELGHWKMSHTLKFLFLGELQTITLLVLFKKFMFSRNVYKSFGFGTGYQTPIIIKLIIFSIVLGPIFHAISFCMNVITRRFEFQADKFSQKFGMTEDLKSALIVLQKENLGNMVPDSLYAAYHYSHPPVVERLKALSYEAKKLEQFKK